MQNTVLTLLFLLLFSVQSLALNDLVLSIRKMYVPAAETQQAVAEMDEVLTACESMIEKMDGLIYIDIEAVQEQASLILLDDFDQRFDPIKLLHLELSPKPDVILFVYIEKMGDRFGARITVKEFPSGIFIDEYAFEINTKGDGRALYAKEIAEFTARVARKKADFGYAFHPSETGLLFVTDSYESSAFDQSMRGLWQAKKIIAASGHNQRLAVKTVFYYFDNDSNYTDLAKALLKAAKARAVIIQSEHSSTQFVYKPADAVALSVLENDLPLWPPFDGFRFYHIAADTLWARLWGQSFCPDSAIINEMLEKIAGTSDNAALLFGTAIRALEDQIYRTDADSTLFDSRKISALYESMANAYNEYRPEVGWTQLNHAEYLYHIKDYQGALQALKKSLNVFDSFSNQFGPLFVTILQGQVYEEMHNRSGAIQSYQEGVELGKALKDDRTLAWLYYRLGALHIEMNRSLDAWSYFGLSAEKYMGLGNMETVITLYTKIGVLLRQNTLLLKSRDYLEQALELAKTMENDRQIADATYHLAVTEEEIGQLDAALKRFEGAGDLMEILGDSGHTASVEEHLGDILMRRGEWRPAQGNFEYAARYYHYIDDMDGVIRCLVKSADASTERGKWQRAQKTLDEALALANRLPGREWPAIILQKKGLAHIRAGDYTAGEKELELARSTTLTKEAVERYMKSLTRDLEAELDNLQPERR